MNIISNGILINAEWSIDYLIAISAQEAARILQKRPGLFIFRDADNPLKSAITLEDILDSEKQGGLFYIIDRANEIVPEREELCDNYFSLQNKHLALIKAELLRIGREVRGEELNSDGFVDYTFEEGGMELIYVTANLHVTILDSTNSVETLEDKMDLQKVDFVDVRMLFDELAKIKT